MPNARQRQRVPKTHPTTDTFELMSPEQVCAALGVTKSTLQCWRATGRYNIPFVKVGRRVAYRKADIEDFLERRTRIREESDALDDSDCYAF